METYRESNEELTIMGCTFVSSQKALNTSKSTSSSSPAIFRVLTKRAESIRATISSRKVGIFDKRNSSDISFNHVTIVRDEHMMVEKVSAKELNRG